MAGEVGNLISAGAMVTIVALICAASFAVFAAIPAGRTRRVRASVLARALMPRRMIRSASGRADIGWMLFSVFLLGAAIGWALLSSEHIALVVSDRLAMAFGRPAAPLALPGWAESLLMTVAIFLAYEFAYWLNHWLSHRVPLLWEFHKLHHSAESLSPLTNFRVHPVDTVIFYNMVALMTGLTAATVNHLLGRPVGMFGIGGANLFVHLSSVTLAYLQHTHLWSRFGPFWGRIFLGPAHHQIHHSDDPHHYNMNLGSALALWDRMFGTFHLPAERREKLHFGVAGMPDPHGALSPLLRPFVDAMRRPPQQRAAAPVAQKDSATVS